jgi:rhodanese-related sulfurtransferase
MVPRRSTPIVIVDSDGGELAARVAHRLVQLGYSSVRILDGGSMAWQAAGFATYPSTYALGQAFGEIVESAYDTPRVSALEVHRRINAGEKFAFFDSRPLVEYMVQTIPGAVDCPGGELAFRVPALGLPSDTTIVVNCAGRTRSIMGAQSLINMGVPNQVVALENGTMGWLIAGFELEHGCHRGTPMPSQSAIESAAGVARDLAAHFEVDTIDHERLARLLADDNRTTYLVDVRQQEEYVAGHIAGSIWIPSWEMAPWVFRHLATRGARIVLVDTPDLIRATATASWLVQIGFGEVLLLRDALDGQALDVGDEPSYALDLPVDVEVVAVSELPSRMDSGATVLDFAASAEYVAGHIPGAWFAIRSKLPSTVSALPGDGEVICTSSDDLLPRYCARDLAALTDRKITVLAGGTGAWRAVNGPLESGDDRLLHEVDDAYRSPGGVTSDPLVSFERYLEWEQDLVREIARDVTAPFRTYPALARRG